MLSQWCYIDQKHSIYNNSIWSPLQTLHERSAFRDNLFFLTFDGAIVSSLLWRIGGLLTLGS
jgi:hypothetical protein